jgi:regulator of nonsense transcripts 2
MPSLPTASQKSDSIQIGANAVSGDEEDPLAHSGGKWEDEEERRFFEDIQDLKDFVPKSVLGIESDEKEDKEVTEEREKAEKEKADAEAKKLEEELEGLKLDSDRINERKDATAEVEMREEEPDGCVCLSVSSKLQDHLYYLVQSHRRRCLRPRLQVPRCLLSSLLRDHRSCLLLCLHASPTRQIVP